MAIDRRIKAEGANGNSHDYLSHALPSFNSTPKQ
jgi:hypothetical protein